MSNYAPDPRTEKVYDNLQNKTLGNVTAEDIQKLTNPTFIQATNQDALLTYNTINQAAMRDGRPMPDKMEIKVTTATDDGVAVPVFTPEKGEIYEIYTGQVIITGRSGNIIHQLRLTDNNNSRSMDIFYVSAGTSDYLMGQDADWEGPFWIDSNITLSYEASGTFTNSVLSLQMTRIR